MRLPVLSNPSSFTKVITSEENRKRLKEREKKIIAEITKKLSKMKRERKQDEKKKKERPVPMKG